MQEKYAELLLKGCLKISNQPLLISAPIEVYDFVRVVVKKAYEMEVRDIYIDYSDEVIKQLQLQNFNIDELKESNLWNKSIFDEYAKKNACFLMLSTYEERNDIAVSKLELTAKLSRITRPLFKEKQLKNEIAWTIASVATKTWANKMFPNEENNVEKLWNIIYDICLVKDDPIKAWQEKIANTKRKAKVMNEKQYDYLYFKNKKGTNLKIKLPKNHIWVSGASDINDKKIIANLPTEEIFTAPFKDDVNGVVYNSKPLVYNGVLIDDFMLKFENGKVVDFKAKQGYETLKSIIEFDENSNKLGEVALVDYNSPISNSKLVFYETLYDENASCHLALGSAYLECVQISEDAFNQINKSDNHVDFMFGTKDLKVIGIKDNIEEVIMENGNFIK